MALVHAEEALELDPTDPFCNLAYGRAKWLAGDAENGLIWVENAITSNPNYAWGFYNRATLNNVLCDGKTAEQDMETAFALSPIDPNLQSMFGTRALTAYLSDDLASAMKYSDLAVNAPNPHFYVFMIAALNYAQAGAMKKAQKCIEAIRSQDIPFGKAEFLTHYDLRDPERKSKMVDALNALGF